MTIAEALKSYNSYPIPQMLLERVAAERGIFLEDTYTSTIAASKAYRLAKADIFYYYGTSPDIKEGDITITLQARSNFLILAEAIYSDYKENVVQSEITAAGYIGESF